MKTTIELPEALLDEVRRLARDEKTTLRALMESALQKLLADRRREGEFKLRKVTFRGNGLQPGIEEASWERIRDLSYEGRGS